MVGLVAILGSWLRVMGIPGFLVDCIENMDFIIISISLFHVRLSSQSGSWLCRKL